jgi:AraC-like DNA-binding protein
MTMAHRFNDTDDPACGRTRRVEAHGFVLSAFLLGASYESPEHAHALSGIVLPISGSVDLVSASSVVHASRGDALLLPKSCPHIERTVEPMTCLLLEVDETARPESPWSLDRLSRINHADLGAAADRLARRLRRTPASIWEQEYEAVEVMLLADQHRIPHLDLEAAPHWVIRAAERLREEFRAPPSLREVARDLGVSREHLARQFRRATGIAAGEFIRRHRVLEAMRLLREDRVSIAAVADAAGFADQSHLSRQFRRYLRITPSAFRRSA